MPVALLVPAGLGLAFLVLPLVGLLVRAPWATPAAAAGRARRPHRAAAVAADRHPRHAGLRRCSACRWRGCWPGSSSPAGALVRALVTVPLVLPPVVGGVALLLVFGRRGLVGAWLDATFGITLPFTTTGVVLAEAFVAMPFLVIAVEGALRGADTRYEEAAATLGAGRWTTFRRVTLPLVAPGHRRRRGAVLGPRARRVRRHHHLRRQLPGPYPDHAAGRLSGPGDRPATTRSCSA